MVNRFRALFDRYRPSPAACNVVAVLALVGVLLMPSSGDAASVTSSGSSDELRCASAAYNIGGSNWEQLSKCYTKTAFPVSWQGTHFTSSSSTTQGLGGVAFWLTGSGTFNGCNATSGTNREYWYGPQTGTPYGDLPAQSVVLKVRCASGTYVNNVNSGQSAAITPPHSYTTGTGVVSWTLTASADTVDSSRSGSAGGHLWWGIVGSSATAVTMAWPPDWYPGGAEWTDISPFCGAEVTSTSHLPADIIENGDSVTFSIEWTVTLTDNVEIRWPGSEAWVGIYTPGVIGNPTSITKTVAIPVLQRDKEWHVYDIYMRCRDGVTDVLHYLQFDDDVDNVGDGRQRPCLTPRVYWPRNTNVAATDVLVFHISYSGLTPAGHSSTIDVEYTTFDESVGPPPGASWPSLTWTMMHNDMPLGTNADYNATAGYDGTTYQFLMRCTDYVGTIYGTGPFAAGARLRAADGDTGQDEASCYSSSGLSTHPSTWVPALGRIGSCILKVLFVPSDEALAELSAAWGDMLDKPPLTFIAEGSSMFLSFWEDAADSATANRTDDLVLLPASTANGYAMPSGSLDFGELATTEVLSARGFLVVLVWLSWLWGVFQIAKRAVFK